MGIDWAFDNLAVIDLKKKQMTFEDSHIRVIAPLDPSQGPRYIEPRRPDEEAQDMDNLYKMTASLEDYVNLTADGTLSWRCASSCVSDSDADLEDWQNRLHEVSQRRCATITKELRWIGSEVSTVPTFDGLSDIQLFLKQYEEQIPLEKRLEVLDIALRATPARWWAAHKNTISSWPTC